MASRIDPKFALGIFDTHHIGVSKLAAKGSGVLDSAYTEAGAVPGHPEPATAGSKWRPQISGAQSVDLETRTSLGGYPGRTGAAVLYRLGTEATANDWRGWNEPNLITDWTAPTDGWGGSEVYDGFAACVDPDTQTIYVTAIDQATGDAVTWSYSPRTGTWTTLYDWTTGTRPNLSMPIGMAYDEEQGRILLWSGADPNGDTGQNAYYSDDGGSTWSLYARGFLAEHPDGATTYTGGQYRIAIPPTGDWLMILLDDVDGTGVAFQFASSDRGVTWDLIDTCSTAKIAQYPVWGPAGFCVVYRETSASSLRCKLLASARAVFDDAAEVDMESGGTSTDASTQHTAVCDWDGTIYVHSLVTGGTLKEGHTFRSTDGGSTWEIYQSRFMDFGDSGNYPQWQLAVASCGAVQLLGSIIGSTQNDGTLSLTQLGGWDQVAMGVYQATAREGIHRRGYGLGYSAGDASSARTYLPWTVPQNGGWSVTTNTGTATLQAEPGLKLTTTAGQGLVYTSATGATALFVGVEIAVKTISGSAALASLSIANPGVYCQIALTDNTYLYRVQINVGTDGLGMMQLLGTAVGSNATVDTTTQTRIRVHLSKGKVWAWYKQGNGTAWTLWINGESVTDGGAAGGTSDYITFGNGVGAAGTSVWRYVGIASYGGWMYGAPSIDESGKSGATNLLGHMFGKALPARGGAASLSAYPIPDATATSEDVGRISAVGGPTHMGEQVDLPTAYTYSIEHIHPDEAPSPRRVWRATGTTEVRIVYDQGSGDQVSRGGAMFLAALRADFRTCALATDDGAGGITTWGTLDKGWGSINFSRSGHTLTPRSGTATIDRYFGADELVGGYVVLSAGAGTVARRIHHQTAGYWTTDATVQRMRLYVDDIDGTEDTSATGQIVHHSGVMVVYAPSETPRRYLRILVAASQVVPDSYYQAGILSAGRVMALGQEPDWGWRSSAQLSRTTRRSADGSLSVREVGPPRRIQSYAWNQVNLRPIRTLSGAESYVAVSGGFALGSGQDPGYVLTGVLEHQLRSGEVPVVLLPRVSTSTTTYTDPTLSLYGRLSSDRIDIGGTLGTEGTDEVISVSGLTIEELR